MLSHVVFKRKEEYSADVVEKPKRHKDKSHKRHKKEESKRKDRADRHHGSQERDEHRTASPSPVRKTAIETEKVPNNGSLSPVRVFQDEEARDILETTPPPEDAASAAAGPPGDDFDALFSRVRPNESGRNKQASGQGEGNAAPAPVIGLCDRGEGLKPSAVMVGDGGASWRLKALKRAQQRAADEGRRLDDEVQQRFESISALSNARGSSTLSHIRAAQVRRGGSERKNDEARPGRASYLEDAPDGRMQRPGGVNVARAFRSSAASKPGHEDARTSGHRDRNEAEARQHGGSERNRSEARPGRASCLKDAADGRMQRPGGADGASSFLSGTIPRKGHEHADRDGHEVSGASQGRSHTREGLDMVVQSNTTVQGSSLSRNDGRPGNEGVPARQVQDRNLHAGRQTTAAAAECSVAKAASNSSIGNLSAAAALRARLRGHSSHSESQPNVHILPQGKAAPGAFGRESVNDRAGNDHSRKLQRYEEGQKVRHFRDDDNANLATLVKRSKHGDDLHDLDVAFASNVLRNARYHGKEMDVDDEYDVDGGLEMYEDRRRRGTKENQEERARDRAVADARWANNIADRCPLCIASSKRRKHLTLSIGHQVYMALPDSGPTTDGHVVICPVEHVPSFRAADEDVFEELKNFRKCLIQMFAEQGKHCIFMETALRVQEGRAHACVECIPVDADTFARAPLVFKQELDTSESEWSQHHAKRIIDTSQKGLRRSIPEQFPYFHVEFGYRKGFVHVIDDESHWPRHFGRSIMVGLTAGRDEDMHQRAHRSSAAAEDKARDAFLQIWDKFDWTKQL